MKRHKGTKAQRHKVGEGKTTDFTDGHGWPSILILILILILIEGLGERD